MSNIIINNDTFEIFNEFLFSVNKKGIKTDELNWLLFQILPNENDKLLITYNSNNKKIKYTAGFDPSIAHIDISLKRLRSYIKNDALDLIDYLDSDDIKSLKNYLTVGVVVHEVEHAYQYLMGEGKIQCPNDILKNAYKYLFDITKGIPPEDKDIYILQDIYKKKNNNLLLERNAEIERFDFLMKLAQYNGRDDLYDLFLMLRDWYHTFGYENSNIGSIFETFKTLQIEDIYLQFNHDISCSENDRIRYGLPISEDTRQKVLEKYKK